MSDKPKHIDPIPEEFAATRKARSFGTHTTLPIIPDSFETVSVEAEFKQRRYEVEIDEETMKVLKLQAEKRGLPVSNILSELLKGEIRPAAYFPW